MAMWNLTFRSHFGTNQTVQGLRELIFPEQYYEGSLILNSMEEHQTDQHKWIMEIFCYILCL